MLAGIGLQHRVANLAQDVRRLSRDPKKGPNGNGLIHLGQSCMSMV